ncbi:hypothetical protein CBW65_00245 [Tumebacillus avium]|uniref:Uncharacterized protein n=1 Tax=Tumebacillus avium TaxID=1903704 RepID=A0A1Y0IJF3_9BACL|nr:hypothetical protein CBW65_00245 [Tumebacillus avium]
MLRTGQSQDVKYTPEPLGGNAKPVTRVAVIAMKELAFVAGCLGWYREFEPRPYLGTGFFVFYYDYLEGFE